MAESGRPDWILRSAGSATAGLHAHGAHVTQWRSADGVERLYLSSRAVYGNGAAIRGGVPVIFPQFADVGALPKHGFVRNRAWSLLEEGAGRIRLGLVDDASTRAIWPQAFRAEIDVQLDDEALSVTLHIVNVDAGPFSFTAALHTYLRVDDIAAARVLGLDGLRYRDSAKGGSDAVQPVGPLSFAAEVDRIYFDTPPMLTLEDAAHRIVIESSGFPDAVVWNPGAAKAAALTDLDPGGERQFVCVESAVVGRAVTLAPGEAWQGCQRLIARS